MRLDQFQQSIFDEQDVFDLIYENDLETISNLILDSSSSLDQFNSLLNNQLSTCKSIDYTQTVNEFDNKNQKHWFMPEDYCPNLVEYLYSCCSTEEQFNRVSEELEAFIKHNMIELLHWLKYFVDTCRENNVLWGVGRGSSVASYVLFLIGVHKIDSLKYNLDWREFLR